jgi:hypothetical protein
MGTGNGMYLELLDVENTIGVGLKAIVEFEAAIQDVEHGVFGPEDDLPPPAGATHHLLLHLLRHCCSGSLLLEELEPPPLIHLSLSLSLSLSLLACPPLPSPLLLSATPPYPSPLMSFARSAAIARAAGAAMTPS